MYVKLSPRDEKSVGAYVTPIIIYPGNSDGAVNMDDGRLALIVIPMVNDSPNTLTEWVLARVEEYATIPNIKEILDSEEIAEMEGLDVYSYVQATDKYEKRSYDEVFSFVEFNLN